MSIARSHRLVASPGESIYRFEAQLTDRFPVGLLPEGLRLDVPFDGHLTDGPLSGARIGGIDRLLIRPDGVGVIDAPETISLDDIHVAAHARGYVLPPEGLDVPPLEAMLRPGFEWPETPFTVRGFALFRTAAPDLEVLNRTVAALSGRVDMRSGRLEVEATAL
jgi:hypothetical protein